MKKPILLIILLLFVLFTGCRQERPEVIERPVFDAWVSTVYEIDKIEMTDSNTVIHFHAFFRPNWWIKVEDNVFIRESGTDEKLGLISAEGLPVGEEYYMPESGEKEFKLFFPPLPPNVTKIDYFGSDVENRNRILGISLLPNQEVSIDRRAERRHGGAEDKPLPEPVFSQEPALLNGNILGYAEGLIPSGLTIHLTKLFTTDSENIDITINEDGSFSQEVPVNFPVIANVHNLGYVFLVPGEETEVYLDLKKKTRHQSRLRKDKEPGDSIFVYSGTWGLKPTDLQNIDESIDTYMDFETMMSDIYNNDQATLMDPGDYKEYIADKIQSVKAKLEEEGMNENLARLFLSKFEMIGFHLLLNYENFASQAYFTANEIPHDQWESYDFQAPRPDDSYYSFLADMLNDDFAYHAEFAYMVDDLRNHEYFRPAGDDLSPLEVYKEFESKLLEYTGTNEGLFFEIAKAQIYNEPVQNMQFYTAEEKQQIKEMFSNDAIARVLISENDNLKEIVENNLAYSGEDFVINEVPDVTADKVFDAILEKQKGKVVVVDFWATWCGPCISANNMMKPVKEELKGEDVVFVYLTGETSPLAAWHRMIPGIKGEHYRVDEQQWRFWSEQFNIRGVPTIMIYDQAGDQVMQHTGFPGADKMREVITETLI